MYVNVLIILQFNDKLVIMIYLCYLLETNGTTIVKLDTFIQVEIWTSNYFCKF